MLVDTRNAGDQWPAVEAGLFGGSKKQLQEAVHTVWTATVAQLRHGPF